MAYTPTTWATGNNVTPALLNNIETGLAAISGTIYSPTDAPWNAPTDGTDATPALDAFFAAVPDGARCYIKRGTYTIQPGADSHMVHLIRKNLEIFGDGKDATIFKVKNSAGNFISMLTNRTSGGSDTDISGLRIHDIGFDHNTANNAVSSIPTLMGSMFRFVLRASGADKANNVVVKNCRFSNTESVCNIIVTDNDNWVVRNNVFDGVGPGAYHDHSTINIRGDGTRIYDNQFIGSGQAAWTAVELHGSDIRVEDNEITAYGRVGNACGTLIPGYNQFWQRNRGKTLMAGITVWAYTDMTAGNLSGTQFAIKDLVIDNNQFELDYDYWSTFANTRSGVELQVGSTASVSRVKITRNTVTYLTYASTPTSTDNNSSGILWRRGGAVVTSGPGDQDVEITDNLVTNSLASAVQFEPFSTAARIKIQRNTGVNPGSGAPASGSKKLIDVLSPTSRGFTVSDITVDNNTAVDTRGTHLMTGVIDLSVAELVVAGRYRDNVVRCADAASITVHELPSSGDWTTPAAITSPTINAYTASATWTKPAGAALVRAVLIAGGSGGGSGRRGAAASVRCGGGGGGGGAITSATLDPADLASTVAVTVGTGGAGGTAITANDTDGNAGSAGIVTSFGTHVAASVGGGGGGGTNAAGTAGSGGAGGSAGGAGGTASATGGAGGAATVAGGCGGGGAGGGITSGNTAGAGGVGLTSRSVSTSSVTGGVVDSTAPSSGTAPTAKGAPGPGGGGGAASITTVAQTGATPNGFGGGGGGGGASLNGNNSGAGGAGAPGYALVVTTY